VYDIFLSMTKKSHMKFKIESGVPLPLFKTNIFIDTLQKMKPNQSIFWKGQTQQYATSRFCRIAKKLKMQITTRKENDGVRIWRVK
jgi:hypothetical protein